MAQTRTTRRRASTLKIGERFSHDNQWHLVRNVCPLQASHLMPLHDPHGDPAGRSSNLPSDDEVVEVLIAD